MLWRGKTKNRRDCGWAEKRSFQKSPLGAGGHQNQRSEEVSKGKGSSRQAEGHVKSEVGDLPGAELSFSKLLFFVFCFFFLHWFVTVFRGLSLVAVSRGYSLLRSEAFLSW